MRYDLPLVLASFLFVPAAHAGEGLPPFLPGADVFPQEVRAEVVKVWNDYTLTRMVEGQPARVPLETYRLFVDHPEVTAAASRHLGLANYRVEPLADGRFAADDGEGARGIYRVLVRDERRRVILTRGSHEGRVLGRIGGASLTILSFELRSSADGTPEVAQRVEAFVLIEDPIAAFFARLLLPLFSGYADRKIAETFNVTARVSEWAAREPVAFCAWLGGPGGLPARRDAFAATFSGCR